MHLLHLIAARFETAKFRTQDRGAAAVEYGLIVGLIAVAIIVAVGLVGGHLDRFFDFIATRLGTVTTP